MEEEQRWRSVAMLVVVVAAIIGLVVGRAGAPVVGRITESGTDGSVQGVDSTSPFVVTTSSGGDVGEVTVHVAGWVTKPGVVILAGGARIADAVQAAGGARSGADLTQLNLAEVLVDGVQVFVPGPETVSEVHAGGATVDDGRVRINQADAATLESLPGVGPVLASRIVEHRDDHGPFVTVEDLLDVPGIGESKLESIREHVIAP